jgi:hypothetical protein
VGYIILVVLFFTRWDATYIEPYIYIHVSMLHT